MQHWVATWSVKMTGVEEGSDEMSRVRAAAHEYESTATEHSQARDKLHAAIRAALTAGLPIGQVARESGFDREHVRRIRDS